MANREDGDFIDVLDATPGVDEDSGRVSRSGRTKRAPRKTPLPVPTDEHSVYVERQVERLREQLLDLSNRNRLLNFKHPQRSRKQVRVIDELPSVLYDRLLAGKSFRFKAVDEPPGPRGVETPVAEAARQQGLNPDFALGAKPRDTLAEQHTDAFIQVLHYPTEMARRLEGMRQEHLTSLQELGVPSLYAVFGFLEWYETPTAESPLLSPLLLVPLEIERLRERGLYQYRVSAAADEPEPNRTLTFRLKRDVGLILPDLDKLIESTDLDSHFSAVEGAIKDMPRWRVRRYVTVCAVSFARQVMYEDLAPERWVERGGRANALLRGLLAGTDIAAPAKPGGRELEPVLVTDADSTQIAAIEDALAGRSMVVKGPPGTGKSQTITNLIAAALAAKKRVLFVAEKMAALEVVKKRLDDAGLANFCLALHSTRAKKRDVLDALDKSLQARESYRSARDDWDTGYVEPSRAKRLAAIQELESYLSAISKPHGALGLNARDIVWREQALRSELGAVSPELLRLVIPNASSISTAALQDAMRCLKELEASIQALQRPLGTSAWTFVSTWDPAQHSIEGVTAAAKQWLNSLRKLGALAAAVSWPIEELRPDELADLGSQLADLAHAEKNAPAQLVGLLLANPALAGEMAKLAADLEARCLHARRVENVCPVEKGMPHRSRLSRLVRVLEETGLLTVRMTFGDIAPRLEQQRASLEALIASVQTLRRHAVSLGLSVDWDPRAQRTVLLCGKLAAEAGRDLLRTRVRAALDVGSRSVLETAAQDAVRLRASRAELDGILTGWDKVGALELRRHATVLRTTGFFGRLFGSTFKASRTMYLSLSTGRHAPREEMANHLQRAAEQLEAEEKAIVGSARVQRACGPAFDGLSTDFEHLVRVAAWGEAVRNAFPNDDALSRWARAALFDSGVVELAELAEFFLGSGALLLRHLDSLATDPQAAAEAGLAELKRVEEACASVAPLDVDARTLIGDLSTVATALEHVATLDARIDSSPLKVALGAFWRGAQTEAHVLRAAISASDTIRDIAFPPYVATWLVGGEFGARVRQAISLGTEILGGAKAERFAREQARTSGISLAEVLGPTTTIRDLELRLASALDSGNEDLASHIRYVMARGVCEANVSTAAFCRALEEAQSPWRDLPRRFEWTVLRSLAADLTRAHPKLAQEAWSGTRLAQLRDAIRQLEDEAVQHRRTKLVAELAATDVPRGRASGARREWTDASLITHEIGKSKRNIPIRALMSRAHEAILALTPCLMMSPLSIAQFLEDPHLQFDLLIVDEASQLRPEDALGALLRAKQVVVVGDEQQLPPTSFFKRSSDEEDEDEEYDDVEAESLLDLAMNRFGQPRVLRWHYRSRHESLIAFSNSEFYRNELVVAPSPRNPGPCIGVSLEFVRGLYEASTNPPEAERVVQLAFELMRKYPKRSIGVVAINQKQAVLIRDLLDAGVRDEEARYIESWKNTLEPFLVKNLENVQGDERDIIVVSMTYGPDPSTGRVYQRFTGIVGQYGHRRLNVLFSRAKHQLVVVTSMKAEDVRAESGSRGSQVLRSYLEYAASRAKAARHVPEQAFERLVQEVANQGFDVVPGVGSQSIALDLGVKHPDDQDGFVAGIELDAGHSRAQLKTGDRELIRPLVLGRLGWSVVQAWTSDWLREPAVARSRMRDGLAEACRSAKRAVPAPRARVVSKAVENTAALSSATTTEPPPVLYAELRADGFPLSEAEIHGSRIRIGRGAQCEFRVPDEYEEVAAHHLELRWDHASFVIADVDGRAGVFVDGVRLAKGTVLVGRQTHMVRLGLGRIVVRLAYGTKLAPFMPRADRTPDSPTANPSLPQMDASERQFVTAILENGQISTGDLAVLLGKSAVRVNGMVRALRRRLHEAGAPPLFTDDHLPNGEVIYRRAKG